ncbi:DUF4118 domain-containing protein [Thauera phenolivorans]|uniref:DUF4118 domain-containing protein n=1 Tax=Thauera phenolivorans TaxID=1792543 RepID=UPI00083B3D47|nr:DUF4118 domain-containing protein [Thauera phenolivorans]
MPIAKPAAERFNRPQRMVLGALACAATALIAAPLSGTLDLANMVMPFLLTVLLVAVGLGREAGIVAAVLAVVLFDVFFVPPRFSLAVSNLQYLITFAVMLATALLTAHLAAGLKRQAEVAGARERRSRALYEVARRLAGALAPGQVDEAVRAFVADELGGESRLRVDALPAPGAALAWFDEAAAARARETGQTLRPPAAPGTVYLPLAAPMAVRGVLALRLPPFAAGHDDEPALLEALASLAAIAIERLHYVEVAQRSELETATERLRSSVLSALSHDLRTPLTVLVGLADSLTLVKPPLPAPALETAAALRDQAARLAERVTKLLDMARLSAGPIRLRKEWQPLEEVVGSSLKLLQDALAGHPVRVELPAQLPLLAFDAVLIERVLCNLLDNAAKYSPPASGIAITAAIADGTVEVAVCDRGPGFPPGDDGHVFGMFVRGPLAANTPGTGLGLAICRAIVDAHGGTIRTETRSGGGACVVFGLPRGEPPRLELEVS